jgi:hypothetical protein
VKTTLQILRDARELLSDEKRWTKSALARAVDDSDPEGAADQETNATDPSATCFCAMGAILRAAGTDDTDDELAESALRALSNALDDEFRLRWDNDGGDEWPSEKDPEEAIPDFNDDDDVGHADVIAAFDYAIAAEERT